MRRLTCVRFMAPVSFQARRVRCKDGTQSVFYVSSCWVCIAERCTEGLKDAFTRSLSSPINTVSLLSQEDALAANRRAQEAAGGGAASSSSAAPDEKGVNGYARANGHATSATASSSGAVLAGSHDAICELICWTTTYRFEAE